VDEATNSSLVIAVDTDEKDIPRPGLVIANFTSRDVAPLKGLAGLHAIDFAAPSLFATGLKTVCAGDADHAQTVLGADQTGKLDDYVCRTSWRTQFMGTLKGSSVIESSCSKERLHLHVY
jgi:hypothetical protein